MTSLAPFPTLPAPARMPVLPPPPRGSWNEYIRRIAEGDADAMAALHAESSRLVRLLTLRILRDAADAEEVAADTFLQVWRTARRFDHQRGSAQTWLAMIARTRAIDRLRSRRQAAFEGLDHADPAVSGGSPERVLDRARQARELRRALEALPRMQREVVDLAFFEELSHTEIAGRTGQPLGTVKTRIRRGLRTLRETLADQRSEVLAASAEMR